MRLSSTVHCKVLLDVYIECCLLHIANNNSKVIGAHETSRTMSSTIPDVNAQSFNNDVFVQSDVRARTNVPHQVYLIKCVTIISHFLVITHVSGGLVVVVVFLLVLTTLQLGHQSHVSQQDMFAWQFC